MAYTDYKPALYQSPNADEEHMGAAMKALSPRKRAVVYWLLDTGRGSRDGDWNDACEAAGYAAESNGSLRVQSHRLRHDPRISTALVEEGRRRAAHDIPGYLATVRAIGHDKTHKDALNAAKLGLGMVGISPVSISHNTTEVINHNTGLEAIEAKLAALELLDPSAAQLLRQKLLPPKIIDLTPESIKTENTENRMMTEEEALAEIADLL